MKVVGKACWIGLDGTLVTAELAEVDTKITGLRFGRKTPKVEVLDGNKNVISKGYANPQDSIVFKGIVVDSATPGTVAGAKAKVKLPVAGKTVVIGGTGVALYDGNWTYDGDGDANPSSDGALEIQIPCIRVGPPTDNIPSYLPEVS